MPNLTLSMIVKNEEANLRDALESVENIVDEIVIVDTGSTDGTLEIAKEFSAKIFHFNWINDFSAARNFALQHSSGNWILYLDADERLETKSIVELKEIIKQNKLLGVNCLINNVDEVTNTPKLMKYIRLFRNSQKIGFSGKAHEQIENSLNEHNYSIIDSEIEIVHLGYNVEEAELVKKAERNLAPLLEEYKTNASSYYAFQLANTYKVLKDRENEIKYHKTAIQDKNLRAEYKSIGYLTLADYAMRDNKLNLALEYVASGLESGKKHPLLNLVASQVYNSLKENSKAIELCKTALLENRKLLNRAIPINLLDIIISEEKIIKHGLYLSLSGNNHYMFNYFLLELNKLDSASKLEVVLIEKLFSSVELDENELEQLSNTINSDSLLLYLELISKIGNSQSQLNALLSLNDKFEKETKYLTKLGLSLHESGYKTEAIQIFENALKLEEKDPSHIFYLISIYVEENKHDKIPNLLDFALNEFLHIPGMQEKLTSVIQKLEPILTN